MVTKTPPIIRSEVVTQINERVSKITDPLKLHSIFALTPWGSKIQQIIEDRWDEVAKQIALKETSKCKSENKARTLYKYASRPHNREANAIYLECWKKFADIEAPIKAASCKTYEEALALYESAPDGCDEAKGIYHGLLRNFEEKLRYKWLQECKTAEEVENLVKRLKVYEHDFSKRCEDLKTAFENVKARQKLLLCKTPEEVIVLLDSVPFSLNTHDLILFTLEKMAEEKMAEETANCETSDDAKRLVCKYERVPNVSKVYKALYLELLAKEARVFVESLTGTGADVIRELYNKAKLSPKESEARRIYNDKCCELEDERDKELLPFGQNVSISDFSGWYTEVSGGKNSDYPKARRMETIFMNQLLEQGLI